MIVAPGIRRDHAVGARLGQPPGPPADRILQRLQLLEPGSRYGSHTGHGSTNSALAGQRSGSVPGDQSEVPSFRQAAPGRPATADLLSDVAAADEPPPLVKAGDGGRPYARP